MSRAALEAAANAATVRAWGQPATYTPQSTGVPESLTAIYDAAAVTVDVQGEAPVTSLRPVLRVTGSSLSVAPAIGDVVTVGGHAHEVRDVQPDSSGSYRLLLWVA